MATARKHAGTSAGTTARKVPAGTTRPKAGTSEDPAIEQGFQVPLGEGRVLDLRVTIASAPRVGSGPRPKIEEMLLIRRIGQDQVLTISAELSRPPSAAIVVGPGRPVRTGGN
ncbi:hypothetical protein [Pseudoxanthomonas sp.]|uniref:hypothetical protein n=1 Tax=Pseudoxanthomonas sp. TaxID=1871049 RepID=UPI002605BE75|nr:hypothetical protein [Pseudoxanthomonas sp.]WDS37267.1 MAG: hypothetical protein O8I58_05100 [Pseudoxanthomonas sp.]